METVRRMRIWIAVSLLLSAPALSVSIEPSLKNQRCKTYRDEQQVLHILALKNPEILDADLSVVACMGYAHGLDRTFQMDYLRHIYQGRKSEWIGYSGIKIDFFMKMLQLDERALKIYSEMSDAQKARLTAYTFGVNHGFQEALKKGVWEYQQIGGFPETWQPHHTIGMILLQSFDQTNRGFRKDLEEFESVKKFGDRAEGLFTQDGLPWDSTVLKEGEYQKNPEADKKGQKKTEFKSPSTLSVVWRDFIPETQIGLGSNNWILAKSKSETGHSFLANDPHLGLKYPPFWHWIHLEGPEGSGINLIGASLPGVPMIASGANPRLAWGLTNSYLKAGDVSSVLESELKNTSTFRPLIWFRWWKFQIPFFFKSYRTTESSWPILPLDTAPKDHTFVMRWSGFLLGAKDFEMLPELFKMKSVKEANDVFGRMNIPSWNFVFSDVQGNIGYRAVGKIPKLTHSPPFGISERSSQELDRWEFLSPDEMPHVLNPKRGWLVTANNRHFPVNSALHGGRAYIESFRAHRIEELLTARKKHGIQSISDIQCDVKAVDAPFFVPKLMEFLKNSNESDSNREDFYQDLKEWDYQVNTDCQVCSLYRRWMDLIMAKTGFDEAALYREFNRNLAEFSEVMNETLATALKDLHFDESGELPTWGEVHKASFGHISEDPRLEDGQSMETPGDSHTVNPGLHRWKDGSYHHIWGASQRMTVELTNPPTVYNIYPGTNRDLQKRDLEDPRSSWSRWKNCEQVKMNFPLNWENVKTEEVQLK